MGVINLGIAVYMLGIISAFFLLLILCCISRIFCNLYIQRQISIMRNHPMNQPVTSGFFAPSTYPDNPNPFAVHGGIYNGECDRLIALLEDKSWMGFRKDVWVMRDLGHELYCVAMRIAWGVSERVRLLGRLMSRKHKTRREEQLWPVSLGDGGESGTSNG